MADISKLNEAIGVLSQKVDELLSKPAPADDQSAIDVATTAVEAITAKLTPAS